MRTAIASVPSASGPITSNVHKGCPRSRCSDIKALTVRQRSVRETHSRSSRRRTWLQMSKSAAATQRGPAPEVSTRSTARGSRESRCETASRSSSSDSGPGPGSRTTNFSVCPVIVADSSPKMRASSSESRSDSSSATWRVYGLQDVLNLVLQRLGLSSEDRLDAVADLHDAGGAEASQPRLIHLRGVGDLHAQPGDARIDAD